MTTKKFKPTSYIVTYWNEDGTEQLKEEIYPMHLYSLDDVIALLKGKEATCDIYEGRYCKRRGKCVTTGNAYVWNGCKWACQM